VYGARRSRRSPLLSTAWVTPTSACSRQPSIVAVAISSAPSI
jgi:hypothetical protein